MKRIWKIKQININIKSKGKLNPSIKEVDLVELFGLNTTEYLRETYSLNMPMDDKTRQF